MVIKRKDGTTLAEVWLQESSNVNEEIMGEHTAQLDFLSRYPIDLEIGDYIEHEGYIYTLRHKESVTKRETSLGWDYSVVMYSARYELQDVPFFLTDQPEYLKNGDYYTGTASDWLALIVKNMNREISGWSAGSCIESEWITIDFKDKQCADVLDELCAQLDTEWEVIGRTLSIGRVEYPSNGLTFSQGEGGGFKELKLSSSDQERPVTVLYPYGQDKNLPEGYGADYLLLPGGKKALEKNTEKYGRCGAKVQFDVYPKGEFEVTSVIDELTFTAMGIDFDISSCLIPDTEVTVSFQSGALAGYDLAIAEDGWDNSTKTIKVLQNEEENALLVPGDLHIAVGDRFTLFNIRMPQSYVDKAEQELEQKAQAWLGKKSEKEVRLSAKCDDILFKQNKISVRCGQMVRILSLELDLDKEIRVTKVKRYIENDQPTYRYELTLSDFLDTNGFKELVKEVEDMPDEIKSQTKGVKEYTRRGFRDVMETFDMMFDPEGSYFQDKIKPLAVHTAQVVVGTNSQQFDLIGVTFQPNKDGDPNLFGSTTGKLTHFTIDETAIREWTIAESLWTLNGSYPYYVYAKCSRTGTEGTILCSTAPIKLEDDPDYYHFWIGVLNTPWDGARSFQPNYGFTEITGQYITTGVIKSKNANVVIDLNKGTLTAKEFSFYVGNDEVINKINISEEGIKINANRVDITGAVTLTSFSSDLLNSWNALSKQSSDASSEASEAMQKAIAAYNNANTALSDASSAWDKAIAAASDASTALSNAATAKSDAAKAISNAAAAVQQAGSVQGALDNLPAWSKEATMIEALESETIFIDGYINTSRIDTSVLFAKMIISNGATIGGFSVGEYWLSGNNYAGIDTRGSYGIAKMGDCTQYGHNVSFCSTSASFGTVYVYSDLYLDENCSFNIGDKRTFNGHMHLNGNFYNNGGIYSTGYDWPFLWLGSSTVSGIGIVNKDNQHYFVRGNTSTNVAYINSSGEFKSGSDLRKKILLDTFALTLEDIDGINLYKYRWKYSEEDISEPTVGVVAQYINSNERLKQFVSYDSEYDEYGVSYTKLALSVAVGGTQALHAKVKALEDRIAALEALIKEGAS